MRAKSLVLLVIALGCGMIAAVAVSKAVMDKGPSEVAEQTIEIFVAVKDLPHAQKISADSVRLDKWPKSRLPEGALVSLEQFEDKFTNQMIFAGEPILERKLVDSNESFSTAIPPGYRVFDILGSAGYIKPGDHVDILGTFKVGGRNAAPETRTVMRNVQVFGINGVTTRDPDSSNAANKGSVFQLLVKESQLEALTLANSMGELRLNLRPFGEDDAAKEDNGESFLSWINETESAESPAPVSTQQISTVSGSVQDLLGSGLPAAAKHQMVIITPNGMKKYEWDEDDELPREVVQQPGEGPGMAPSNSINSPSGNVYSGYGGYSPTYPTSTLPSPSASGSAEGQGAGTSPIN